MSELEIRVRTRLRKRTDIGQILPESYHYQSAWTDQTCLDYSDQPLRCCYPAYKNKVTIELDPETLQMMQKENVDDACIDVEISDDDEVMMMENEEELDTFESSPLSVSSQTDSPNNATSSPINIPGNSRQEGPRTRRLSSGGTPTHTGTLSYLGRMFPGAHCDSSPLSSGYGSAPKYFHSASTQTPPSTPVFCETLIRLRISSLSSNSSDGRNQQALRRQRMQMQAERRVRGRVYSENNGDDLRADDGEEANAGSMEGVLEMPLPDLVFRDRANSAPSLMRPEIRVGRQLRRISDEFHLTYHDQQRLRARQHQTILQRLLNTIRGSAHHGHREGSEV